MKLSSFTTILIFIVLITVGLALLPVLSVKLKPSATLPSISVSYSWQGATGRVIEQEVTSVLEGMFSKIRGVKKISSTSSVNSGNIQITFDKSVDFDAARFEVASFIRQTYPSLPDRVTYPSIRVSRPDNETAKPILTYTLNAPASPYLIKKYAEDKVKPQLSSVKGISDINVYGSTPTEWVLVYDNDKLRTHKINTSQIQSALSNYLARASAGMGYEMDTGQDTLLIHLVIRNYNAGILRFDNIPVITTGTRIITLKDLVTIKHQEQEPSSYYRINGANSINIVIYAGELENQLRLSAQIKNKIAEIGKILPAGYFLLKSYDATEYITEELNKNAIRTVFTVVLLLIFVLAVSRQFRYLFLILISLIANLSIAFIFYYIFKVEIHLYSLAGITVSLGLILDNSIVMIDHIRHHNNIKVFLATLAATVTTMAALVIVFFLDERVRLNLSDFSSVLIINLAVSLFVALFLIPALMEKFPIKKRSLKTNTQRLEIFRRKRKKRLNLLLLRVYERILKFIIRFRLAFIIIIVIGFGIPTFLLPQKIESDSFFAKIYNKTLGSPWYTEKIKNTENKILGGSLRLFVNNVYESSYYADPEKTTLFVNPQMPQGATLSQLNELVGSIESYLLGFNEIEQFQSTISSPQSGRIMITFKKEFENSGFPFFLKEELIHKAIDLGGADWSVYGIGDGFNNSLNESTGSYQITMYGYNYDELFRLAETLKGKLLLAPRVRDVNIISRRSWGRSKSYEFVMDFDYEKMASLNILPRDAYNTLKDYSLSQQVVGSTVSGGEVERIRFESQQSMVSDLWELENKQGRVGDYVFRLKDISKIKRELASIDINKENQQYLLIVAYDYIGTYQLARMHQQNSMKEMESILPLGYTATIDRNFWYWGKEAKKQYWLLLLICGIIFMICSVLLESLLQPLAVIFMIPLSYIGLFLTFYLFKLNFDQGGFAAFVLLSGITVNSSLYIINDYNNLKLSGKANNLPTLKLYLKAFNHKIFPILLTIFSTILGLVPFLWGGQNEVFWPALAAGSIGGLVFSLIGIFIYLPILMVGKRGLQKKVQTEYDSRKGIQL